MARGATTRETIAVGGLIDNPRNPRTHPEEQLERLAQSIKRFGQPRPILARKANRMIIAGHGVREASRRAGLAELEVVLWDVDQKTADAFMLADNRFGDLSEPDSDRVAELLSELGAADYESVGYDADEVAKLLAEGDDIAVEEIDTDPVHDEFWITIRGPLGEQANALAKLRAAMAEMSDVSVELGTTPG